MSFLIALLQLISFTFGGATFEARGSNIEIEKRDLLTLPSAGGPVNPCASGCR